VSVILFSKAEVYQTMADSYEGLKHLLRPFYTVEDEESKFYTSLRRLYFANVAAYLCQYHDEPPLSKEELQAIDPFLEIQGQAQPNRTSLTNLAAFLKAWASLRYNLTTNAGEQYKPCEAFAYMEGLARRLTEAVVEQLVQEQQ
jgi:hypothetical protein